MSYEKVCFITGITYAGKSATVHLLAEKHGGIGGEENGRLRAAAQYGDHRYRLSYDCPPKMANAATMAGMAFANAFLGVCHAMAHKLGESHHIAHGVANALMIEEVLRFNAAEAPTRMGTFPQYDHPHTLRRCAEVAEALGMKGDNDNHDRRLMGHPLRIRPGRNFVPAHEGRPGQQVELFISVCRYSAGSAEQDLSHAEPAQG